MILGEDPRRIERLWQRMYRGGFYRGGPVLCSAISGIEHALWDILGKSLGVPVHQLLGGAVRDRVRMYGWTSGEPTGDYIENFMHAIEDRKFTAYKFCPVKACRPILSPAQMDAAEQIVARARQLAGDEIDIALDFHGRTTPAMSRRLAERFEKYNPLFIEEPVLPGDTAALREIARATPIPVATGERLFTRWQFQEVIEQQAVAVIQPDLSHVGGIFEARKIAAAAEARNIVVAPHCPLGPIALAASLQLDACTPNFLIQEHVTDGRGYLKEPIAIVDGYAKVPDGPGLGIEVDEEALKRHAFAGDWETPRFTLEDGCLAEW
jgi:galactonate dehydratase